jgi:type IV secretion system protein VirB10
MPSADEYRSLDLEAAAQSGVARSSNVLGNTALIGVPLAALAFVGWLLYSWQHKDAKLMTAADKEEFNTQQYPGPGLPAERPSLDLGEDGRSAAATSCRGASSAAASCAADGSGRAAVP